MRLSLLFCVGNYVIVFLTGLALQLDYVTSYSPLLIRLLFYPFAIFSTLVFFPALAGVIIGIGELRSRSAKGVSAIAVIGNLTLMVGYVIVVRALWPALMGI